MSFDWKENCLGTFHQILGRLVTENKNINVSKTNPSSFPQKGEKVIYYRTKKKLENLRV